MGRHRRRASPLSQGTALKQVGHRAGQDFDASYYALVQRIIDEDEWFESGKFHVAGYLEISPKMWLKAVLKRDMAGRRLYLVTLHRERVERLEQVQKSEKKWSNGTVRARNPALARGHEVKRKMTPVPTTT